VAAVKDGLHGRLRMEGHRQNNFSPREVKFRRGAGRNAGTVEWSYRPAFRILNSFSGIQSEANPARESQWPARWSGSMKSARALSPRARAEEFAARLGIRLPILLAPMAGACPPSLSIAVASAGGMGACGALLMAPEAIAAWAEEFRRGCDGAFQMNLWIPELATVRDAAAEQRQREFLAGWGPEVSAAMGDGVLPDFAAQFAALLAARPGAISSIMGVYAPQQVTEMKARGILWFAVATTVAEARAAEAAGADAIVAQGMEAGGHRGSFRAADAEAQMVGLFALLPQIADAVAVPVIAAGGIGDARGVAAALLLGASAVQVGTGFLRSPEAGIHPAYAERLGRTEAHETAVTRAFSGRAGRGIANRYVEVSTAPGAPPAAPYPIQRGYTRPMREEAQRSGDTERMQMWAGQGARLAQARPAGEVTQKLWAEALPLLR
jgi:nitronate monooxygenase